MVDFSPAFPLDRRSPNALIDLIPRNDLSDSRGLRRIRILYHRSAIIFDRYHSDEAHCFWRFGTGFGHSDKCVRRHLAGDKRDWSSLNYQIASVSSTGMITGALAGNATIRATSAGLTGELNVVVVPGAPASIVIYSGTGQSAAKGSAVTDPLCTNVKDAAGNWLIGATVTYVVSTGGGQVAAPATPVTNSAGIAISGAWTLGPNAGTQTVTASSPGAGSVVFSATAQ
jgi:hypothetical protein